MPSLVIVPGLVGDEGKHKVSYPSDDTQIRERKDPGIKVPENEHGVIRTKQSWQFLVQGFREDRSDWTWSSWWLFAGGILGVGEDSVRMENTQQGERGRKP